MVDIHPLNDFNPWWAGAGVPESLLGTFERPTFSTIKDYLDKRFILLIYGLRRVGKTTLLYQVIRHLLETGTDKLRILYFSFDDARALVTDVVSQYEQKVLKNRIGETEKTFFFFDEIQKVDDWQSKIKILYDLHPNLKILLSGSAAISLQQGSKESLGGRVADFHMKPLSFAEFVRWKGVSLDQERPELFEPVLAPLFMDHLRKGGFPEMVGEARDDIIQNYVRNTILDRIIYRDLPAEFGLKDVELLGTLVEMFCLQPGMIINTENLSRDLGRSRVTVSNYIKYLRYALLIRELKNIRPGALVSSRKDKKIFPSNTTFCFAYKPDFYSEDSLQGIAEVAVADALEAEYYYRDNFEVDFVARKDNTLLPVEVKYGKPQARQVLNFLKKFNQPKGILVTRDAHSAETQGVETIPLWRFLLRFDRMPPDC